MADEITIGGGLDPALSALIVRLLQLDLLSGEDLNVMARRVDPETGMAFRMLAIESTFDDSPKAMRAGMHAIDGGNGSD